MRAGQIPGPIYRDSRDLTPFGAGQVRTPVREIAEGVGGMIQGVLGGRDSDLIGVEGSVPRLKLLPGRPAKAVHDAIFNSTDPNRLIAVGREHPGWGGLCYVLAGLLSHKQGGYLRAVEVLQRGLGIRGDGEANQFAARCLTRVVTRVEAPERGGGPVWVSEEAVFLALSQSLRETGQTEAALEALTMLPPSLPTALAKCALAYTLGRDQQVVVWTEGLLNADDLSAALLLVPARSLRRLGAH